MYLAVVTWLVDGGTSGVRESYTLPKVRMGNSFLLGTWKRAASFGFRLSRLRFWNDLASTTASGLSRFSRLRRSTTLRE
jgi:hypothetical protein